MSQNRTLQLLRAPLFPGLNSGWNSLFLPISSTCGTYASEKEFHSATHWGEEGYEEALSVAVGSTKWTGPFPPDFSFPAVPQFLQENLEKVHDHPAAWWIGQIIKYIMRPNQRLKTILEVGTL